MIIIIIQLNICTIAPYVQGVCRGAELMSSIVDYTACNLTRHVFQLRSFLFIIQLNALGENLAVITSGTVGLPPTVQAVSHNLLVQTKTQDALAPF